MLKETVPSEADKPQPLSTNCDKSMVAASGEHRESDKYLLRTLKKCKNVDEWAAGLQTYPDVGILISYSRAEAIDFLDTVCVKGVETPVCIDAEKRGMLSYRLSDPRLHLQ
ncbi:MAG: hypothetical protein J0H64_09400 [Actinobacteria bacterium]|nr:hypothetical protein [Actinomycetota bacterium]